MRRKFLRKVGRRVTAESCANDHHHSLRPDNGSRKDEGDSGDAVDYGHYRDLEGIHFVNFGHAKSGEQRQVHNADASAEVASVGSNQEFKKRGARDGLVACLVRNTCRDAAREVAAESEKERGSEHEPWNHAKKGLRGGLDEKKCSG